MSLKPEMAKGETNSFLINFYQNKDAYESPTEILFLMF